MIIVFGNFLLIMVLLGMAIRYDFLAAKPASRFGSIIAEDDHWLEEMMSKHPDTGEVGP